MIHRRWIATVLVSALIGACGPATSSATHASGSAGPASAARTASPTPTAAPTPSAAPAATRGPAAVGRILFESSFRDPKHTIFEMDPDGSNVVALPNGPNDHQPAWSPDHQLIALVRGDPAPAPGVYVMHADGSRVRRVASSGATWAA